MKKENRFHICLALLSGVLIFVFSACGLAQPIDTPTPDWNPLPTFLYEVPTSNISEYMHYTPSDNFDFRLEFDYPSSWPLVEHVNEIGWPSISMRDPRFLALPTSIPDPDYINHIITNFGTISIFAFPIKHGQTIDTELAMLKQNYGETGWMKVLNDYKTTIDGHDANVLEYQTNDPEGPPATMFNRRIFFMVNNQMYEILYTVAEKDRGGEFDQGFDYFLKSIKILP